MNRLITILTAALVTTSTGVTTGKIGTETVNLVKTGTVTTGTIGKRTVLLVETGDVTTGTIGKEPVLIIKEKTR